MTKSMSLLSLLSLGCLTLCAAPHSLRADDAPAWPERIDVGLYVGVDFASIGGSELNDPGVDYSSRAGFVGGGSFAVQLTRFFSVQTDAGFSTKGYRADALSPINSGTQYIGYLELPILLRASLPISKSVEPYVNLGPAIGVVLDGHFTFDDGRVSEDDTWIEPLDIGLLAGAGAAIQVGDAGAITIDIRYNLGLQNIVENAIGNDDKAVNRVIYLTVGYRADLATLGRLFGRGSRPTGPAEPAAPVTAPEISPGYRR